MKATRLRESESRSLRIQDGESTHVHVSTYYTIRGRSNIWPATCGPSLSTCHKSRTRENPTTAAARQLVELVDSPALKSAADALGPSSPGLDSLN